MIRHMPISATVHLLFQRQRIQVQREQPFLPALTVGIKVIGVITARDDRGQHAHQQQCQATGHNGNRYLRVSRDDAHFCPH